MVDRTMIPRSRRRRRIGLAIALLALALGAELALRGARFWTAASGGPEPLPEAAVLAAIPGQVPSAPDLTIAFIGDSGAGPGFEAVLELVKRERAQALVHLGDALYVETPAQFWGVVDRILGHDYPYFLAQGNHDLEHWPDLAAHGWQHLQNAGTTTDARGLGDPRLAFVHRGVSLIFLGQAPRLDDPRFIVDRFAPDPHIWKVCAWHKNQSQLQLGGKDDEMGWGVYESCRQMGALIANGHEHSYQRTRTLASTVEQRVDPTCPEPGDLCVRPGAVPVFVSGLGGQSVRRQRRCLPSSFPYGCRGEWAFAYTSDQGARYGALFLTFNVGGDPRRGRGYFKNVDGQVVDRFDLRTP